MSQLDDDINALGTRYTKPIYLLPDFVSAVMKQSTTTTTTSADDKQTKTTITSYERGQFSAIARKTTFVLVHRDL